MTTTITYIWGWRKPPGRDIDSVTIYSFFFSYIYNGFRGEPRAAELSCPSHKPKRLPDDSGDLGTYLDEGDRHEGHGQDDFVGDHFDVVDERRMGTKSANCDDGQLRFWSCLTIFDGRALIWRPPGFAAIFMSAVTVREAGRRSVSE